MVEEYDVVIVGSGPAGLAAAEVLGGEVSVCVLDEQPYAGGQLIKQTHKFFGSKEHFAGWRGIDIAEYLIGEVKRRGVELKQQHRVLGYYAEEDLVVAEDENGKLHEIRGKKYLFATGAMENMFVFENNDLPGIFGAGAAQTLMNMYGVKPGTRVVMLGAGNIGLIVSYQMLQAGIDVAMILDASPTIGGYHVHAAKVVRAGVPIRTRYTVKRAIGEDKLEAVEIVKLDENWSPIDGTEEIVEADLLCISIGLSPVIELFAQAGCRIEYVPFLGGYVPVHNKFMKTTNEKIFVAGDASGIEEASTAMVEGKIAALAMLGDLKNVDIEDRIMHEFESLAKLRTGFFGRRPKEGKIQMEKLASKYGL